MTIIQALVINTLKQNTWCTSLESIAYSVYPSIEFLR